MVARGEDDFGISLTEVIAHNLVAALGKDNTGELPYMLKLLGVGRPLSMQVHPTTEQARAGYDLEEAAGLDLDAPNRSYKDPNAKPEMLYSLTSFEALSGFRPVEQIRTLLAPLVGESAIATKMAEAMKQPAAAALQAALSEALRGRATTPEGIAELAVACRRQLARPSGDPGAYALCSTLAKRFPGDGAVAASLLLCHLAMAPGEAFFVPPGTLHAYQRGLAVEVLGPSDNVIRAGMSGKHVDQERLINTVDYCGRGPVRPLVRRDGPARIMRPPVADFQLADIRLDGTYECPLSGPRVALVLAGQVTAFTSVGSMHVSRGQALFAMANEGPIKLRGRGRMILVAPGPA